MFLTTAPAAATLYGRDVICETLACTIDAIRDGESGALVLRGEPGIGKTALLDYAVEIASDLHVVRTAGVESEAGVPFAGLHELCAPMLGRAGALPAPQREALRLVFGIEEGEEPSPLIVGVAALGLLTAVGREQPLLCVVDDAHWLDRESALALGLVARRLRAEPVGLLLAGRDSAAMEQFSGLEERRVGRLSEPAARRLLAASTHVSFDERVRDRLIVESRGIPTVLTELSPLELAGGLGLTGRLSGAKRLAESDRRRLANLPAETRRLLLLAAAEPLGDPILLWRAARQLGIGKEAAEAAEAAELVHFDQRVVFQTPLLRTSIYSEATPADRRAVHGALAEATDPRADPDRQTWHRAEAADQPDERLAADLMRCAGRARARGFPGEAAALLERSSVLTRDPELRAARGLAAAEALYESGAPGPAMELLAAADLRPLGELQHAQLDRLRGLIAFDQRRGIDACPMLRRAARRLAPLHPDLARSTDLDALGAAAYGGRFYDNREAPAPSGLRHALGALRNATRGQRAGRFGLLAFGGADFRWDVEECDALARHQVERARREGAISVLPFALGFRAAALAMKGDFTAAEARIEEADAIAASIGIARLPHAAVLLAAWRGDEGDAARLFENCARDATAREEGLLLTVVDYATAVLENGLGRYPRALAAAERACGHEDLSFFAWALPELVEAAVRSGRPRQAAAALERLGERVKAGGTAWGTGIEARSRALLGDGGAAESHYRIAIDQLGRAGVVGDLARAHLLYGEWLRREGRRVDSREQLRPALRIFMSMGAQAFAARAERELAATAETARPRTIENGDDLTPQEEAIAWLAREGFSNPEIGTRLFISPRTVEYHLHKVFRKLGVSSRHQLGGALAQQ